MARPALPPDVKRVPFHTSVRPSTKVFLQSFGRATDGAAVDDAVEILESLRRMALDPSDDSPSRIVEILRSAGG